MGRPNHSSKINFFAFIVVLLILLGLLFFLGHVYYRQWQQRQAIKQEVIKLRTSEQALRQTNEELEKNLKLLGSVSYKAKIARSLNLKIEGEEVIIFPENLVLYKPPVTSVTQIDTRHNIIKWWNYFFNP